MRVVWALALFVGVAVGAAACQDAIPPGATCGDGQRNADETDVDCGGVCGASCAFGARCDDWSDCLSEVCVEGGCAGAPCSGDPCHGRGTCLPDGGCECAGGFAGPRCLRCAPGEVCDDTPRLIVDLLDATSDEGGGAAEIAVRLNAAPSAAVQVSVSSSRPLEAVPEPAAVAFGVGDWWQPRVVTLRGLDDGVMDETQQYTLSVIAASADVDYDGLSEAVGPLQNHPGACGNGLVEPGEACDAGQGADAACAYGQTSCQVCTSACQWGQGAGVYCGDGVVQRDHEACDGAIDEGLGCTPHGALACSDACDRGLSVVSVLTATGRDVAARDVVAYDDGSFAAVFSGAADLWFEQDLAAPVVVPPRPDGAGQAVLVRAGAGAAVRWTTVLGAAADRGAVRIAGCDDGSLWTRWGDGPPSLTRWSADGAVIAESSVGQGRSALAASEMCDAWSGGVAPDVLQGDGIARPTPSAVGGGLEIAAVARAGRDVIVVGEYRGASQPDPVRPESLLPAPMAGGRGALATRLDARGQARAMWSDAAPGMQALGVGANAAGDVVLLVRSGAAHSAPSLIGWDSAAAAADRSARWRVDFEVDAGATLDVVDVAVADAGDAWVVGSVRGGSARLQRGDSATTLAGGSDWDLFVVRLDAETGDVLWSQVFAGPGADRAEGVAVGHGAAFIAGTSDDGLAFTGCEADRVSVPSGEGGAFVVVLGAEPPGVCVPSPEVCDGRDDDCDGATDEGVCDCVEAGACAPPRLTPVSGGASVSDFAIMASEEPASSWFEAQARCHGDGLRLCTVAELARADADGAATPPEATWAADWAGWPWADVPPPSQDPGGAPWGQLRARHGAPPAAPDAPDGGVACCWPPGGAGGRFVPEGSFMRGCAADDARCGAREPSPASPTWVPAFSIDAAEVSRGEFAAFAAARGDTCGAEVCGGDGDLPVTGTTWTEARDYCHWRGRGLCDGAQWEKAARGTDARWYPWGRTLPECDRVWVDDGSGPGCAEGGAVASTGADAGADEVARRGASPYGVAHLVGNVSEWVADGDGAGRHGVRGGSYERGATDAGLRVSASEWVVADAPAADRGFRCCACPDSGCERCDDGLSNGGETGVDCGGATDCPRCPAASTCAASSDCEGVCNDGLCEAPRYGWVPRGPKQVVALFVIVWWGVSHNATETCDASTVGAEVLEITPPPWSPRTHIQLFTPQAQVGAGDLVLVSGDRIEWHGRGAWNGHAEAPIMTDETWVCEVVNDTP